MSSFGLTVTPPRRMRGQFLGEFSTAADSIEEAFNRAQAIAVDTANAALNNELAKENRPYVVYIDGRPASGRDDFRLMTRQIRVTFPIAAIELSLSMLKNALIAEIKARTSAKQQGRIVPHIRLWYGKADGRVTEVSAVQEIKDFSVGDWVAMVPDTPLMLFINSEVRDTTGKGFMARTAARIKRTLRLRKNVGGLQIIAGRSRAIGTRMNIPPKQKTGLRAGRVYKSVSKRKPVTAMPTSIYNTTAIAIFVRWRPANIQVK